LKALVKKELFVGLDRCTWLYSGAETPSLRGHLKAAEDYLLYRGEGPGGREKNASIEQSCKENIAALINGRVEDVAFLSNTSEVISMIAQSLELEEGDNVIINTLEFPSGVLPWLALTRAGIEVRVVPHKNWEVCVDDVMAQVDENTKLVMSSHVSFLSGARIDYESLYRKLGNTNALLLLDVTQSFGVIPVDINQTDFLVSSSYKWLLAPHGLGVLGINPARTGALLPKSIGWRSVENMFNPTRFEDFTLHPDARRFELGFPSYPTIYALNYSTNILLNTGIERIQQYVLSLGGILIEELEQLGYEVMTPFDPDKRAGNISMVCSQGEDVADSLRRQGIYVWGGDNRLRASVHAFNDSKDIGNFITALKEQGSYS
jgi:selenocysteine lyase/cysteine desulfurase